MTYILRTNFEDLVTEIRPSTLVDDMLDNFIIVLKDHQKICQNYDKEMKMAEILLNTIIENVEKGSYPCLLYTLKNSMENEVFRFMGNRLQRTSSTTTPETGM